MNELTGTGGAPQAGEGGFMVGNDATQNNADDEKVFKAIIDEAVSSIGTTFLSSMIMDMKKEMDKEES